MSNVVGCCLIQGWSECGRSMRCDSWPVKMRPTAAPETSSENLPCTPCKNPKTKTQRVVYWAENTDGLFLDVRPHQIPIQCMNIVQFGNSRPFLCFLCRQGRFSLRNYELFSARLLEWRRATCYSVGCHFDLLDDVFGVIDARRTVCTWQMRVPR
jgi:hypothetical protein